MTSNWSSSSWTCRLRWSWSNHSGALSVISATCLVMTGTIAHRNSATAQQEEDDHHRHGEAAPKAASLEPLDAGVEARGDEQRDEDEDQHAADALELVEQPARHHEAEATEEADVERGVPVQAGAGPTEVGVRPVLLWVGLVRLVGLGHPGGDLGWSGSGARGRGGRAGGLPAPEDQAPALSSSESSLLKPATTSRSEASWAVIASRRLLMRSTSARMLASSRCASAWAVVPSESA